MPNNPVILAEGRDGRIGKFLMWEQKWMEEELGA